MKSKKKNPVDFKNLTPQIQIKRVCLTEVYRKSLLEDEVKKKSDYSANTTTWD